MLTKPGTNAPLSVRPHAPLSAAGWAQIPAARSVKKNALCAFSPGPLSLVPLVVCSWWTSR